LVPWDVEKCVLCERQGLNFSLDYFVSLAPGSPLPTCHELTDAAEKAAYWRAYKGKEW